MKRLFTLILVTVFTLCGTEVLAQDEPTTNTNKITFTAGGTTYTDVAFTTGEMAKAITGKLGEGSDVLGVTSLTVSGELGANDIYTLRYMGGASNREDHHYEINNGNNAPDGDIHNYIIQHEYKGERFNYTSNGSLQTLDLSEATFKQTNAEGDIVLCLPTWKEGVNHNADNAVEWYAWRFYTGSNVPQFIFTGCSKLQTVTLPKGATEIGQHAFSYCSGLKTVNNIGNILKFGGYCFDNDRVLGPITLNDDATEIGYAAFRECNTMTFTNGTSNDTKLPSKLTLLDDLAFAACNALTTVTVGPNVSGYSTLVSSEGEMTTAYTGPTMKTGVFQNCKGLTKVLLPSTTTTIGYVCFAGCNKLEEVRFYDATLSPVTYAETAMANEDGTQPVSNNNVVNIIANAFDQCHSLKAASIGQFSKAELIGAAAFSGCHLLSDGNFEMLMKSFKDGSDEKRTPTGTDTGATPQRNASFNDYSINNYTFADCWSLTKAVIPDKVVYIGQEAFRGDADHTTLTEVTLSANLKSSDRGLGDLAFSNNIKLTKVTVRGEKAAKGPAVLTEKKKHTARDENDTQEWDYTYHNPFNNIEPNQVEVVFDHSEGSASDASHANYESYLKEPCFTYLLTKTASEMDDAYNIVKQQHGILKLKRTLKEGWNTLALPFQACYRNMQAYGADTPDSCYNFTPIARGLNQTSDPTTNVSDADLANQTGFMVAVYRGHNANSGVFDFMVYTNYKTYPLNFGEPFLVRMTENNLSKDNVYTFYDVDLGMKYTPDENTDNLFSTTASQQPTNYTSTDMTAFNEGTTGEYNHDANAHFQACTYNNYKFTPTFTVHKGVINGSTSGTAMTGIDIAENDMFVQNVNGTAHCYTYKKDKNYGIRGFSGYFHKYSTGEGAKEMNVLLVGDDGETTGMLQINADGTISEERPADVYSLSGQVVRHGALSLEGLGKGIYIYKGKKVIVK